jgi:hypothetical protein
MWAKLSKADEVFDPERAEDWKQKSRQRAEARAKIFKRVTRELLKSPDFCEWLEEMMISFGFWSVPHHELAPFDQGRRSTIHELVERVLMNGGEEAQKWFKDCSEHYVKWIHERQQ